MKAKTKIVILQWRSMLGAGVDIEGVVCLVYLHVIHSLGWTNLTRTKIILDADNSPSVRA